MRNRFLLASAAITFINLLLVLLVLSYFITAGTNDMDSAFLFLLKNRAFYIAIITCVAVSCIFSFAMYNQIMKPVHDMHEKLAKMTEESKRVEQIRSEFVANVTHELKTPLTSISGFIETLQDGAAENPEIRNKFIDIIAIETSRLERLIEDLLVLSEIENKKITPNIGIIDTKECLLKMITAIEPIASGKNIIIQTSLVDKCYIEGNVDRFTQMMVNLIENAIKYSNENSSVFISSRQEGGKIIIDVTDKGIGIAEEHFSRLFERFYRVDKSRTKKAGGTGLGLSIVKHIAYLLNAEVKVKSKLGEGSTFTVIFNRKEV
ncbi:sensor histidine kinase [Clostridium aminobutyricum]|uniref:histidine kinase n=1 Tax=Clostridium aminobutyricum TaxID=33953 RepID=A0A939D7S3_CLOAM|nr:ATP-binding protein [Clostridium aminobutyricum]MBN7772681.1 hypothetical protein [Clostridium aminobutyricum]